MTNLMLKGVKPETAFNAMEDARKGKGVKKYRDELRNNNVED
jgi:DNA polymerase III alpha subunit (gram-positive type)